MNVTTGRVLSITSPPYVPARALPLTMSLATPPLPLLPYCQSTNPNRSGSAGPNTSPSPSLTVYTTVYEPLPVSCQLADTFTPFTTQQPPGEGDSPASPHRAATVTVTCEPMPTAPEDGDSDSDATDGVSCTKMVLPLDDAAVDNDTPPYDATAVLPTMCPLPNVTVTSTAPLETTAAGSPKCTSYGA